MVNLDLNGLSLRRCWNIQVKMISWASTLVRNQNFKLQHCDPFKGQKPFLKMYPIFL